MMHELVQLLSKNITIGLLFKFASLVFSIIVVDLAGDQNEDLLRQVLLFQVSVGYLAVCDLGIPSHLKAKTYAGSNENDSKWLAWFIAVTIIVGAMVWSANRTWLLFPEEYSIVVWCFIAIFVKFAINYLQSKRRFATSYFMQAWVPMLLVIYLFFAGDLITVNFDEFIMLVSIFLLIAFIISSRPIEWTPNLQFFDTLRGSMVFLVSQALTLLVFGLHEYVFIFFGEDFLGWTIESRYYLFIAAIGPVVSNVFWAYLGDSSPRKRVVTLFVTIAVITVWGILVFLLRDEFFAVFWSEDSDRVDKTEALAVWMFYQSHTIVLFISGYFYAMRKERLVLKLLLALLICRFATLVPEISGWAHETVYLANGALGVTALVMFLGAAALPFGKSRGKM